MEDNPCCQSLIQTFLIIFNCIAFVASGGVLGFSIYALVDGGFNKSLLPEGLPDTLAEVLFDVDGKSFQLPVVVLATVSALVLFVSFLGCVGSCRQSRCLVALYFVCLFTFLLALMAASAYCFMGDPQKPIAASMRLSMKRYKTDNLTRVLWDKMQTQLSCCGAESIDDWAGAGWGEGCSAPWSCKTLDGPEATALLALGAPEASPLLVLDSKELKESSVKATIAQTNGTLEDRGCLDVLVIPHSNEGCLLKLQGSLHKYINIVGAILISVWIIVIINVLFSFALCVVLDYAEYTYK